MNRLLLVSAAIVVIAGSTALDAQKKAKPNRSVALARSWDAAVEEAKLLNVPIVVHSHGFYCPPCWGMHSAVLENKAYIKFAEKHTVEVCVVSRLQEGIEKGDRKAGTYTAKDPTTGKEVEYLTHWPGLTVEDMTALSKSKAGSYNNTGKIPYTCIVDPHTLEQVKHWSGGQSSKTIMGEAKAFKKELEKKHGPGLSRKQLEDVYEAERALPALVEAGDFAKAVKTLEGATTGNPPEALAKRVEAAKKTIVDAAAKALEEAVALAKSDPAKGRSTLAALVGKLRGTGLEAQAKEALAATGS